MEKKIWAKPEMNEVLFTPNAYCVSECDDKISKFWKFICNLGTGKPDYYDIYLQDWTNTPGSEDKENLLTDSDGNDTYHNYYACGTTHLVKQEDGKGFGDVFEMGWADDNIRDDTIGKTQQIYIWRGDGDVHATTNISEEFETVEGNHS